MKLRFLTSLFVFLLCFAIHVQSAALPQSSSPADYPAVVHDPSGRAIVGAKVTLDALSIPGSTSHAQEAITNDRGFTIHVPAGKYRVTITHESFATLAEEIIVPQDRVVDAVFAFELQLEPLSSTVVVTAESTPVESAATTAPVNVITKREIDRREQTTLPALLATEPGFSLARTGPEGGQATIFLDGGNSNYTKVLIDGAPANESGGFVDISNFTLDDVDKIEVVHGAESAIYGSDAMAGVVQILTHRGATRTPELDLAGEGGSFGTGRGSGQVSGLLGAFDYSIGANYLATSGQGPNDRFINRGLSGNFGWKIRQENTIRLSIRDNSSFASVPGQTLFLPPDLAQSNARHNFYASLTWEGQTGPHWHWRVGGTEASQHVVDNDPPFLNLASQFNRASVDAQSSYIFRRGTATAGYYYEVENAFPSALGGEHARRNNQAGFFDLRLQPRARLTLNAGVRAEDNSSFGTRVVPRAGISYVVRQAGEAIGATRLHAFYGQGIDEPRLDQSFGNDPCFPGNPNLRPELSRTGNAGLEQRLASDRVRVTSDFFYNQFRDIISFAFFLPTPACSFGVGTFFNTDLARARGIHFNVETQIRRWLTLAGHYTYDDSRVLRAPNAFDPSETAGNRLFRRPLNSGTIELNAAYRKFNFNLLGYITGQRTDSDFLGLGFTRNPGYSRFDAAASYALDRRMSIFLRAGNVLDRQYQDALGYPALGREVRGGVKLKFGGE